MNTNKKNRVHLILSG